MDIGSMIKNRRIELGYSQTDLAHKCEVTPPCICQWEKNKRKPDARSLVRLSKTLNMSTDALLGRQDFSHQKIWQDPIARRIMEGFDDLSDEQRSVMYHFVQFLKSKHGEVI